MKNGYILILNNKTISFPDYVQILSRNFSSHRTVRGEDLDRIDIQYPKFRTAELYLDIKKQINVVDWSL